MKLNFSLLDSPIQIKQPTILTVEDQTVFSRLVTSFYHYEDVDEFNVYDKKHKVLKSSELMLVTDVLGYEINSAPILKLIHQDLEQQMNDKPELKTKLEALTGEITALISYECIENEMDLEYDEITIMELIKALGVKIETRSDSIFEKMIEIMQVFQFLKSKRVLVFLNTLSYLNPDEIGRVIEFISLSQLNTIFIEPRKIENYSQFILDKDYILWPPNVVE